MVLKINERAILVRDHARDDHAHRPNSAVTALPVKITELIGTFKESDSYYVRLSVERIAVKTFSPAKKARHGMQMWVVPEEPSSIRLLTHANAQLLLQVFRKPWISRSVLCSSAVLSVEALLTGERIVEPLTGLQIPEGSWFRKRGGNGAGMLYVRLEYQWNELASPAHLSSQPASKVPALRGLRDAILAMSPEMTGNHKDELITRIHLDALWTTLSRILTKPLDHTKLYVVEDLLWQLCEQIGFLKAAKEALLGTPSRAMLEQANEMMTVIARTAVLTYSLSGAFDALSYDVVEHGQGRLILHQANFCQLELLRQRINLLLLWKEGTLDDAPKALLPSVADFLMERTLLEDWENPTVASFCSVLYCLRGKEAEFVLDQSVKAYPTLSREMRDTMRRVLVHLMHRSRAIPHFLDIPTQTLVGPAKTDVAAGRSVSQGAYAQIFEAQMRSDSETWRSVAIKVLKTEPGGDELRKKQRAYMEAMNVWSLRHKNVVEVLGITYKWGENGSLSIISPWMVYGDASRCISKWINLETYRSRKIVEYSDTWICQVADALTYVHEEELIHGDLRSANILVDEDLNARLADFGLTIYANGQSRNYFSTRTSNPSWLAPEIALVNPEESSRPTKEADIYAFALLCIELYTGKQPWDPLDVEHGLALLHLLMKKSRPGRPVQPGIRGVNVPMDSSLWDLVQRCWQDDPAARPRAREVFEELLTIFNVKGESSPTFSDVA